MFWNGFEGFQMVFIDILETGVQCGPLNIRGLQSRSVSVS